VDRGQRTENSGKGKKLRRSEGEKKWEVGMRKVERKSLTLRA